MLVSVLYFFFHSFYDFPDFIISTIIFYGPPYKTLSCCCFLHHHKHWKEPSKTTTSSSNGISFFSNNNIFDMMESETQKKGKIEISLQIHYTFIIWNDSFYLNFFPSFLIYGIGGWENVLFPEALRTKVNYVCVYAKMQI